MNILPKKRWHVRTKANIERVRKDEAEARELEEKEKSRIQIAEREAKINYLKNKRKFGNDKSVEDSVAETLLGNLDNAVVGSNKEHDKEEKEIKEKYERKIGVLSYLANSELESKPWYLEKKVKKLDEEKDHSKRRSYLDPLNDMKKFIDLKEKSTSKEKVIKFQSKKKCDKNYVNKTKTIEELRAKRLQRERKEHEREKLLIQRS